MQVLSGNFLSSYGKDIINIHHGLLPSFKGGNPSKQVQFSRVLYMTSYIFFPPGVQNSKIQILSIIYYWQAFDYGVKLIGATSHFVTEELDSGPIIEQMVFVLMLNNSFNFHDHLLVAMNIGSRN